MYITFALHHYLNLGSCGSGNRRRFYDCWRSFIHESLLVMGDVLIFVIYSFEDNMINVNSSKEEDEPHVHDFVDLFIVNIID